MFVGLGRIRAEAFPDQHYAKQQDDQACEHEACHYRGDTTHGGQTPGWRLGSAYSLFCLDDTHEPGPSGGDLNVCTCGTGAPSARLGGMRIATYNVNGVNGRLPVLLKWLRQTRPDVVCLQELKSPDERFPERAISEAGYGAIWQGQKSWNGVAILALGRKPEETRRGLPGSSDDTHSRYIEAAVDGVLVGCLYVPNGNPRPGPKFDYKLAWLERLKQHAATLLAIDAPVVLAGDFNIIPTAFDVYKPERWTTDALFVPEVREAFAELVREGWIDALRKIYPDEKIYTFWDYFRRSFERDAGLRIDHFLLNPPAAKRLTSGGVDRATRALEKTSDHAPAWIDITPR